MYLTNPKLRMNRKSHLCLMSLNYPMTQHYLKYRSFLKSLMFHLILKIQLIHHVLK
jgi:hypothetical protein